MHKNAFESLVRQLGWQLNTLLRVEWLYCGSNRLVYNMMQAVHCQLN